MKKETERFTRRGILCGILLLALAFPGCGKDKEDPSAAEPPSSGIRSVQVSKVESEPLLGRLEGVGTILAHLKVNVASEMGGTIENLYFEKGERVRKGQVLAEISTKTLEIQVQQAEGALAVARSQLRKTETGSRPEEIQIARADVEQAQAALREAENNYRRIRDLHGHNAVSNRDYDAAHRGVETARARLESARQQLALARQGPREEDREAARARLEQAAAALAMAEDRLRKSIILSPCDGVVAFRDVEVQEVVGPGTVLTRVVDLRKMKIRLSLSETDLPLLDKRGLFPFAVDAIPGREFNCRLTFISPTADPLTRSFPLEFSVDTPDPAMADGMTVKVRFPLLDPKKSIKVPSAWLSEQDGHLGLFVVEGGRAVFRRVILGSYYEHRVEILSGLSDGELVIITPSGLRGGDPVRHGLDQAP